ncbi:MAG: T9SS type A sorting domain-containing protein [Parafilimonas sp.]
MAQLDGKIVGGGQSLKNQFNTDFIYMAAARLNANGSIDSSFGNNGLQHIAFGKDPSDGRTVLLQDDGKIIITGRTYDIDQTYSHLALIRLNINGTFDSSFGNNGQTITEVEGFAVGNNAFLESDGKIALAGISNIGAIGGNNYFLLARYNNNIETKKQQIITKIRRWIQHRNGIVWDNAGSIKNYIVQRSGDGTNWSTVHSQRSIVNSQLSTVSYYNDPTPLSGNNYYRLQTTSVNGTVNYSNVIAVTADEDAIKISPNPATNNLHVEGLSSNTKLTVLDFSGNVKLRAVANNSSYNLNIASLITGNYLLKIEMNDAVVTKKFVKE